ncbi:MAG: imidazole glycerol phosphate synthase subunit HisF, partial [Candidatus Margulisbacteria bacterium]|nr:imidazole glycerol phosphate synthase subunit HisF [Candidatus Margulisiibacteriota bacterium]
KNTTIPIIASGGAGNCQHIVDILQTSEAALLASLLHFKTLTIPQIKQAVNAANLPIR